MNTQNNQTNISVPAKCGIKSITIKNFRGISDFTHTFTKKTSILIGKNGRGKTAFKEAMYAALTGDFPTNCIKHGTDGCMVSIVLTYGTRITREQNATKPNRVLLGDSSGDKITTAKNVNNILAQKTGLSAEVLKVVTSTDMFQSFTPAEFGSFLTTCLKENLNCENVLNFIPKATPHEKAEIEKAFPPMPQTFNIETVTKSYDKFVEQRKFIKRDVVALRGKLQFFRDRKIAVRSIAEIDNELNELLRKEGAQNAAKSAIIMYNNAVENKKKAEAHLLQLKAKIDANTAIAPDVSVLADIKSQRETLNKNISNARAVIFTTQKNIASFKQTIENLEKPICPISNKLVCRTDKTAIKAELEQLIFENEDIIARNEEIIASQTAIIANLDTKENQYRENEASYKEKVSLSTQYEAQKKNMPELPPRPEGITVVNYAPRIKELKDERDYAIKYEQYLKDKDELTRKEVLHETYDKICGYFSPKGEVMNGINSHYVSIFSKAIDTAASLLKPGLEIKFISDAGIHYVVKPDVDKEFVPLNTLSSGEQLTAIFTIMFMFHIFTGVEFLFLDNLDKLDAGSFGELLDLLQNVEGQYKNIILCAVDHKDTREIIDIYKDNVEFIY